MSKLHNDWSCKECGATPIKVRHRWKGLGRRKAFREDVVLCTTNCGRINMREVNIP